MAQKYTLEKSACLDNANTRSKDTQFGDLLTSSFELYSPNVLFNSSEDLPAPNNFKIDL